MPATLGKRIALDMDEVMADTLATWLERCNKDFGTRLTKADLHGKKIYDLVGSARAVATRGILVGGCRQVFWSLVERPRIEGGENRKQESE
jgi:hypothetical protein